MPEWIGVAMVALLVAGGLGAYVYRKWEFRGSEGWPTTEGTVESADVSEHSSRSAT